MVTTNTTTNHAITVQYKETAVVDEYYHQQLLLVSTSQPLEFMYMECYENIILNFLADQEYKFEDEAWYEVQIEIATPADKPVELILVSTKQIEILGT